MSRALVVALLFVTASCDRASARATATTVVDMAISDGHACAVRSDGAVWCWGWNRAGAIGDGTTTNRKTPTLVRGIKDATAVEAGHDMSCARVKNGTVWCWGAERPSAARSDEERAALATAAPTQVSYLDRTKLLSVGPASMVCGRLEDGETRCIRGKVSFVVPALKGATAIEAGFQEVSGVVGKTLVMVDLSGDEQKVVPYNLGDGIDQIDKLVSGFAESNAGLCISARQQGRAVVMCQRSSRDITLPVRAIPAADKKFAPVALSVWREHGQAIGADGRLYKFQPFATLSEQGDSVQPMRAVGDRADHVGVWSGGFYSCQAFKNGTLTCAGGFDGIDGPDFSGTVTFK